MSEDVIKQRGNVVRYGGLLFSAYCGAVVYAFFILWFGAEPLRTLQDFQTLIVGLPAIGGLAIAYRQWREDRSRYVSDKEESYQQELDALQVAIDMADYQGRWELAELVRYTLDENVAKLDEVPTDDIAFVITHTKSYGIQRLVNVLARRLGEQAELAEKLNASDEATWDPLDKTKLAMHNAVAKTASDKLREAANQRLAIIERRTRLHQ